METHYHCSPEWHLSQMSSKYAATIYNWSFRLAKNGRFFASQIHMGEYFDCHPKSIGRALDELEELGFFELLSESVGESKCYRPVKHNEWKTHHPGKCAVKSQMPWSKEKHDLPAQQLYSASGGKLQFHPFQLTRFRNYGLIDVDIVDAMKLFAEQVPDPLERKYRKYAIGRFAALLKVLATIQNGTQNDADQCVAEIYRGTGYVLLRSERQMISAILKGRYSVHGLVEALVEHIRGLVEPLSIREAIVGFIGDEYRKAWHASRKRKESMQDPDSAPNREPDLLENAGLYANA